MTWYKEHICSRATESTAGPAKPFRLCRFRIWRNTITSLSRFNDQAIKRYVRDCHVNPHEKWLTSGDRDPGCPHRFSPSQLLHEDTSASLEEVEDDTALFGTFAYLRINWVS
jgi:hypothetical protein